MPTSRRPSGSSGWTARPRTRTVPAVGASSPAITDISVVLPAPFGPSRPNSSPSATVKLTPCRAVVEPYWWRTSRTSRRGPAIRPMILAPGPASPARGPSELLSHPRHFLTVENPERRRKPCVPPRRRLAFGSGHPGVVQFCFADGSVRSLRKLGSATALEDYQDPNRQTPMRQFLRMGGFADGEVIDETAIAP